MGQTGTEICVDTPRRPPHHHFHHRHVEHYYCPASQHHPNRHLHRHGQQPQCQDRAFQEQQVLESNKMATAATDATDSGNLVADKAAPPVMSSQGSGSRDFNAPQPRPAIPTHALAPSAPLPAPLTQDKLPATMAHAVSPQTVAFTPIPATGISRKPDPAFQVCGPMAVGAAMGSLTALSASPQQPTVLPSHSGSVLPAQGPSTTAHTEIPAGAPTALLPSESTLMPPPTPTQPLPMAPEKPKLSYAQLIYRAINSTPKKRLTLSSIYQWISSNYPFFQANQSGWQNSIRHNLSLNKGFVKVPRPPGAEGKGCYWTCDESVFEQLRVGATTAATSTATGTGTGTARGTGVEAGMRTSGDRNAGNGFKDGRSKRVSDAVHATQPKIKRAKQGYQAFRPSTKKLPPSTKTSSPRARKRPAPIKTTPREPITQADSHATTATVGGSRVPTHLVSPPHPPALTCQCSNSFYMHPSVFSPAAVPPQQNLPPLQPIDPTSMAVHAAVVGIPMPQSYMSISPHEVGPDEQRPRPYGHQQQVQHHHPDQAWNALPPTPYQSPPAPFNLSFDPTLMTMAPPPTAAPAASPFPGTPILTQGTASTATRYHGDSGPCSKSPHSANADATPPVDLRPQTHHQNPPTPGSQNPPCDPSGTVKYSSYGGEWTKSTMGMVYDLGDICWGVNFANIQPLPAASAIRTSMTTSSDLEEGKARGIAAAIDGREAGEQGYVQRVNAPHAIRGLAMSAPRRRLSDDRQHHVPDQRVDNVKTVPARAAYKCDLPPPQAIGGMVMAIPDTPSLRSAEHPPSSDASAAPPSNHQHYPLPHSHTPVLSSSTPYPTTSEPFSSPPLLPDALPLTSSHTVQHSASSSPLHPVKQGS